MFADDPITAADLALAWVLVSLFFAAVLEELEFALDSVFGGNHAE